MKFRIKVVLPALALAASLVLAACQNPLQVDGNGTANPNAASRTVVSGTTRIEAESYTLMSGVQLEACSEGGQNVGWIDAGDWMVYPVTISNAGSYTISYRVACPSDGKRLSADINAGTTVLGTLALPNTGGWQNWSTVKHTVTLPAGTYNLGVNGGAAGGFNLNWIEIAPVSVIITAQPADQKATPLSTATFWVAAASAQAISYQWYRNGQAIAGATGPVYATAPLATGDGNASYSVTVRAGGASVTSRAASLTVNHDVDDILAKASGKSWTSAGVMGNHFQNLHATTDADRAWLANAANDPPVPPGLVNSLHLQAFPVTLYPSGNPSPSDINQHAIGDCNGITALANLAYMVPGFVKSLIIARTDGSWDVAMFDPQGKPVTVRLSNKFLADSGNRIACVTGKNDAACWSALLEKAVMKYNAVYRADPNIEGIGAENVIPLFTGVGSSFAFDRGRLTAAEITRVIKASLACGKFISGGFGAQLTLGKVYAVPAHGYECFWPADGMMIAMRNPWGANPIVNNGGYDSSTDGVLNIPAEAAWAQTIDLRIADPGIAGSAGRTSVFGSVVAPKALGTSPAIRLSPAVAHPELDRP